jgi:hypothetical protein
MGFLQACGVVSCVLCPNSNPNSNPNPNPNPNHNHSLRHQLQWFPEHKQAMDYILKSLYLRIHAEQNICRAYTSTEIFDVNIFARYVVCCLLFVCI